MRAVTLTINGCMYVCMYMCIEQEIYKAKMPFSAVIIGYIRYGIYL